ncbi:ANK2 [Symbiodinium sp. CCMP2592]|nr:ANK2 [Symbiodinium sp. CCMP2592]
MPQRISKHEFADMICKYGDCVSESYKTVPHSLRGMALGQLEHLEALFVQSGWLATQCDTFNEENAQGIQENRIYRQACNLYALNTFVVTPMSKPGTCAAREQDPNQTVPQAHKETSFSELVNTNGLFIHCFMSHYWGHLFSKSLAALKLWAELNFRNLRTSCPESLVFWICLFALNQHDTAEEVGENPMQGPFNAALAHAEGGAVMVLDEEINPFKRIWCLFEISRLKELKRPFELICEMGSLSRPETLGLWNRAAMGQTLQAASEALAQMSASKAEASMEQDKFRIWRQIADPDFTKAIDGLGCSRFFQRQEEAHHEQAANSHYFRQFDLYVRSLLSTSLLQLHWQRRNYAAAAQCLARGAHFTEEQLRQIWRASSDGENETRWLQKSLRICAEDGRTDEVRLLLAIRADVTAATRDGWTALMAAAQGGHVISAQLLLAGGADVSATTIYGCTALLLAAQGGHEVMVKLLLAHGSPMSETACTFKYGTALMIASQWGHEAAAKLILERQADIEATSSGGCTALMLVAQNGHKAIAQLLLESGADVAATTSDGWTVTGNGRTAATLAHQDGHFTLARLLGHCSSSPVPKIPRMAISTIALELDSSPGP